MDNLPIWDTLNNVAINGSTRSFLPHTRCVARAYGQEVMDFVLRLRAASIGGGPADPNDVALVTDWAKQNGLTVVDASAERRRVALQGTVELCERACGVELYNCETPRFSYRGRQGEVKLPLVLQGAVTAVLGLDNRPQATQKAKPMASSGGFLPTQMAKLYNFPNATGMGQTIAIIELGGGYRQSDLDAYFGQLGLPVTPVVTAVGVDGAQNRPGQEADGEVCLDIDVVGGLAPGAKIVVVFAPNSDMGFTDAINYAVHVVKANVISISWGGPEASWTSQARTTMDNDFQDAAQMGVSVYAASGDNGSSDGSQGLNVDYPAASPWCCGCGGTNIKVTNGAIVSETVWNDQQGGATGGGYSKVYVKPSYQTRVPGSMRGVPDVAGPADPATGWICRVNGQTGTIGGTSAVAPMWAALTALLNTHLAKPLGFPNPVFYMLPANSGGFSEIISGSNGGYQAGPLWNPCCGLGSPNGNKLLGLLAASGTPPVTTPPVTTPPVIPPPVVVPVGTVSGTFVVAAQLPAGQYTMSLVPVKKPAPTDTPAAGLDLTGIMTWLQGLLAQPWAQQYLNLFVQWLLGKILAGQLGLHDMTVARLDELVLEFRAMNGLGDVLTPPATDAARMGTVFVR